MLMELCFYVYIHFSLIPYIQPITTGQRYIFEKPDKILSKCCSIIKSLHSYSFDKFLSGWFLTNKCNNSFPGSVLSSNMDSWLAWVIFTSNISDLSKKQLNIVKHTRNNTVGLAVKKGHDVCTNNISFSLKPITHLHHHLFIYFIFWVGCFYTDVFYLYKNGFNYFTTSCGLSYWYRKCHNVKRALSPVIIFHGIYSSWSIYSHIIDAIGRNRTIILINYDGVKLCSLCTKIVDPFNLCQSVIEIIEKYKISKISIFAHSWGTFLAGWIVKLIPMKISNITFIDPVALTIFLPETTYAILYKPPYSIMDYLLYYFIRNDLTISYNLHRHFEWYNTVVFLDEIPKNIGLVVGISLNDELICGSVVIELVDKCILERSKMRNVAPVQKIVWESFAHTEAISRSNSIIQIIQAVNQTEKYNK